MDLKLLELLLTYPAIFLVFGIAVWLLTYLLKKPIKNSTSKIKNEQRRKKINKWILLIPFFLGLVIAFIYNGIETKTWLSNYDKIVTNAFKIAAIAIVLYNFVEGLRGKKTEYELTEDGRALYELIKIYAKDTSKVKILLDQCKDNWFNKAFSIAETVKGFLPGDVDPDVINTVVKSIERYFRTYGGDKDGLDQGPH